MSSVDRLLVQGVRSFGPENKSVIEFDKPLTLIVGKNGAGKTTVIEALKYATTGQGPPPNIKNITSFLHDPKIAGEPELKAQIKLKFTTVAGKACVCTRSMQVQQKQSKLSAKTIDSTVQMMNDKGEKVSASRRCADIDVLIPRLMGVSKAVLTNVIFCHQEDANWPLAPPTELKAKFDEIFAASRYRKALDEIKEFKKDQTAEIKTFEAELNMHKEIKTVADGLRKQLAEAKTKIESTQGDVVKVDGEVAECTTQINEVKAKVAQVQDVLAELQSADKIMETLVRSKDHLFEQMKEEFTETDEELLRMTDNFRGRIDDIRNKMQRLTTEDRQLAEEVTKLQDSHTRQLKEHGKIAAEAELHAKRLGERDERITMLAKKHNIGGYSHTPYPDHAAAAFHEELHGRAEQRKRDVDDVKKSGLKREEDVMARLDAAKNEYAKVTENLKSRRTEQANLQGPILRITAELEHIAPVTRSTHEIEVEVKRAEDQVAAIKREFNMAQSENNIIKERKLRQQTDELIGELETSLRNLSRLESTRNKLKFDKEKLAAKELQYKRLIDTHRSPLEAMLHGPVNPHTIGSEVEKIARQRRDKVMKETDVLNKLKNEHSSVGGQLQTLEETRTSLEQESEKKRQRLAKKLNNDKPLPEMIKYLEQKLATAQKNKTEKNATSDSAAQLYKHLLEMARSEHYCPICERGFDSTSVFNAFLEKLQATLEGIGKAPTLEEGEEDPDKVIEETTGMLAYLGKFTPDYERVEHIVSKELPQVIAKIVELTTRRDEVTKRLHEQEELLNSAKVAEKHVSDVKGDAEKISEYFQEHQRLRVEVEQEEQRLGTAGSSGDSLESVQRKLEEQREISSRQEKSIERLRNEQARHRDELHGAERKLSELQSLLVRTKADKENRDRLEKQLGEMRSQIEQVSVQIEDLSGKQKPVAENVKRLTQERDNIRSDNQTREKQAQEEYNKYFQDVDYLATVNRDIEAYVKSNKGEDAAKSIQAMERMKTALQKKEQERGKLQQDIETNREFIATAELTERSIADNIAYRQALADIEKHKANTATLKKRIEEIPDGPKCMKELEMLQKEMSELLTERAEASGRLKVYDDQRKKLEADLNQAKYKEGNKNYRKQLIKLKTTTMARDDLNKYQKALDAALMRYHTMKMEEINKIIAELWKKTYKGSDIDTIAIRSDETTKANYNYRVVMVKGGHELVMRGRCSAGQKVLASLIIRLALAETFCLNCGILALDEPTTNLDKPNVESFARALLGIVEDRSRQYNFQLIVITHDEHFTSLLAQRGYTDYYWRVYKDDSGQSQIAKQEVGELTY